MYAETECHNFQLNRLLEGKSDPALQNDGRYRRLLTVHRLHVLGARIGQLPSVGPFLKRRIADARMMRCSLDHILSDGGNAAGVDGLRPSDLTLEEGWSMSRALAKAVRDKTYRPGPSRLCPIPKRPGSIETRTLTIQTVPDRIVAGDVRLIIQPVLDPMLAPFSFARPGRGAQHALATVLALAKRRRHWVWIVEDIKAFYDQIIHSRLMRALSSWLPDAGNVVEFVNLISHTGKKRGVRQGSSLSPLLAHIFRDHHITRPWQHRLSQLPLFSYLDDLLVPCESVDQAHMAYDTLSQLVTSAGLKLKGNAESNICRVAEGQEVIYLGYHLQCQGRQLRFTIAERAWCSLEDGFIEAHEKPCPPVAADAAVRGWLEYLGPCYRDETREAVLDRVYTTAAAAGFDELPSRETLMNAWFAAYGRWRRLRKSEAEKLDHRLILNAATADAR